MCIYSAVYQKIINDPEYLENIEYGEPRRGHPEGAVKNHIRELEKNLDLFAMRFSEDEWWKLLILIHVHDTFKKNAKRKVSILDPNSHASLAKAFLSKYLIDTDILNMVQYHDEWYAIWRKYQKSGEVDEQRCNSLLGIIKDWRIFSSFVIIDSLTDGKDREPLKWFIEKFPSFLEINLT